MKKEKSTDIVIVESGATKSEWRRLDRQGHELNRFFKAGSNVSAMKLDDVKHMLTEAITSELLSDCAGFYLYTAGIVTPAIDSELTECIKALSPTADIEIQNDLMGAARAACLHSPGIVAILGTGSNTCYYDGHDLHQQVYSGGYILGDEGSGAALGKRFLADYIKGLVPNEVAEEFSKQFDATYAGIVQNVYHSASPSGFLGSLAPFMRNHCEHPYVRTLIESNFQDFITRSLMRYDVATHPVGIVGGMAWAFQEILRSLMEKAGIKISRFIKAPIDGLCQYHINQL